ncbi:hypothetical protein Anapl_14040 [Anas platyrhynchos]|uniref:Uncharacterized protein n=1 Tax=Anas platyrhynchos TaxID=8839 RepID=R0LTL5_ANAPL|nr:hypothetical protein Anapl_14040 [Anas platyrhynchos]
MPSNTFKDIVVSESNRTTPQTQSSLTQYSCNPEQKLSVVTKAQVKHTKFPYLKRQVAPGFSAKTGSDGGAERETGKWPGPRLAFSKWIFTEVGRWREAARLPQLNNVAPASTSLLLREKGWEEKPATSYLVVVGVFCTDPRDSGPGVRAAEHRGRCSASSEALARARTVEQPRVPDNPTKIRTYQVLGQNSEFTPNCRAPECEKATLTSGQLTMVQWLVVCYYLHSQRLQSIHHTCSYLSTVLPVTLAMQRMRGSKHFTVGTFEQGHLLKNIRLGCLLLTAQAVAAQLTGHPATHLLHNFTRTTPDAKDHPRKRFCHHLTRGVSSTFSSASQCNMADRSQQEVQTIKLAAKTTSHHRQKEKQTTFLPKVAEEPVLSCPWPPRGRTSSPEGPDEQDQTEKLRGDSYNHQADSVWNDTPIAENMSTYSPFQRDAAPSAPSPVPPEPSLQLLTVMPNLRRTTPTKSCSQRKILAAARLEEQTEQRAVDDCPLRINEQRRTEHCTSTASTLRLQLSHHSERSSRPKIKSPHKLAHHRALGLLARFQWTAATECPLIKADASLPISQQHIQELWHNEAIVSLFFTCSSAEQKVMVVDCQQGLDCLQHSPARHVPPDTGALFASGEEEKERRQQAEKKGHFVVQQLPFWFGGPLLFRFDFLRILKVSLDKHYTWQTSLLLCVAQTTPNASLQNKQKESVRAKTKFTIPDHSTGHAGSFFPKEPGDVTDTEACGLPPALGHSSAGVLAPQALTHQEKEGGDRNVPAGGDRHVSPSPAGGLLPEHTVTSVVQTPAFRRG